MIERLLEAERALSVGLLDHAERLYRGASEADPRNSIAVVGLARVALERGDENGAYTWGLRALEIDSDNQAARRLVDRLIEVRATRGEGPPRPAVPDETVEQATEPAATELAAPEPRALEPAATEPAVAEPTASEGAAVDGAAVERAAVEPVRAQLPAAEPPTEPATEPVAQPRQEAPPPQLAAVMAPPEPTPERPQQPAPAPPAPPSPPLRPEPDLRQPLRMPPPEQTVAELDRTGPAQQLRPSSVAVAEREPALPPPPVQPALPPLTARARASLAWPTPSLRPPPVAPPAEEQPPGGVEPAAGPAPIAAEAGASSAPRKPRVGPPATIRTSGSGIRRGTPPREAAPGPTLPKARPLVPPPPASTAGSAELAAAPSPRPSTKRQAPPAKREAHKEPGLLDRLFRPRR